MKTAIDGVLQTSEYDACGIYARLEKNAQPSRAAVLDGLDALRRLNHRGGYVRGEGDGCGLLMDIPKRLWRRWLENSGQSSECVRDPGFFVAHLFVPRADWPHAIRIIQTQLHRYGLSCKCVRSEGLNPDCLGPVGRLDEPVFVQLCGLASDNAEQALFRFSMAMEHRGVHVASASRHTVVYKVIGDAGTLWNAYEDLRHPHCTSAFVISHTRFSTNTGTRFSRVQPFATVGHNGEINTILRFASEADMVGIRLNQGLSDSQILDFGLRGMTAMYNLSLFEAMELLFPPIHHEIRKMPRDLANMYHVFRAAWGPFAQGPAALMVRLGQEAIFSVDALGLRPLWQMETADAYCFASEQTVVPATQWIADPRPLAPGEKIGVEWKRGKVNLYPHETLTYEVLRRCRKRAGGTLTAMRNAGYPAEARSRLVLDRERKPLLVRAVAHGWRDDDSRLLEHTVRHGTEAIQSLGYDGPLAVFCKGNRLLSDFLQESVAVVTNPAIDREREVEHFSTAVVLGRRPALPVVQSRCTWIELSSPLLLEHLPVDEGDPEDICVIAQRHGDWCLEEALAALSTTVNGAVELGLHRAPGESVQNALLRLSRQAVEAVQAGAHVIMLDDRHQFQREGALDPFLALRTVHLALCRPAGKSGGEHLRRRTSLVMRACGLRNLHDVMVALGLGADAVSPRLIWELAARMGGTVGVENAYLALRKGIEKVISTIGIHELRGYERLFASIGLQDEVARRLGVSNFCGSLDAGYGWLDIAEDGCRREELYQTADERALSRQREFRLVPRVWKSAGAVASGEQPYSVFSESLKKYEQESPVQVRHALSLTCDGEAGNESRLDMAEAAKQVDTGVDIHSLPFVISSMSFGSQGETSYRAYAEAAYRLNIVALNGEGGEIKDLLGCYPRNRGRQVASGRFGVNAELCNGAYVLEIKIGQGAKPGEGGHLPGSKVTPLVASARNAAVGIDLISPSNNHDIYSIEDLAQVVHELRQINPDARIAVKVPVVPNIGTIAVGIVKAGADIVNLSGYDGGTGAARAHALRHVGLPVEIGIVLAHNALCAAGLRDCAEIWADGGMKSGRDVVKAILLGANRVGFGTMAMVAIGCTGCRACHKDTCHVGIATQIQSQDEARERGLPAFVPRELELSVQRLHTFFCSVAEEVQSLTAALGMQRTQDLVGQRHLLRQSGCFRQVDLTSLLAAETAWLGMGSRVVFRDRSEVYVDAELQTVSLAVNAGITEPVGTGRAATLTRSAGVYQSGVRVRSGERGKTREADVRPDPCGSGFAAYHTAGMYSVALGGAQDGVAKGAFGGKVVILKHKSVTGAWYGGSVGKSLAYGAQRGLIVVQGSADSRAGVRLSGADLIVGAETVGGGSGHWRNVGAHAAIKGFAFEYMTAGRALVMGDPGPWICSGMTGGTVYVRHRPEEGLTEDTLRSRIAKGARVRLSTLDGQGERDVLELLLAYHKELRRNGQSQAARRLLPLMIHPAVHFRMIRPGHQQTDQSIATE